MTREEKQKAIDALKISAPVIVVTQEEFNDYIQTLNKIMDWLEQEPTTKNDLGVDCISRQDVLSEIIRFSTEEGASVECQQLYCDVNNMPSVTPQEPRWIPVSEKLPHDRDWYLGIFKEPDTGWVNPLPFICDYVGSETKATTKEYWILRGFTDRDERIDYYFNLECVAWMPLPTPYEPQESEK